MSLALREGFILLHFKINNKENAAVYGFLVILAFQLAMMLFFCVNKQDYHIDEIYSYVLSNSYDCDKLKNAYEMKNRWISGKTTFRDFVTVQRGERFSYGKTYYNNTTDAHPPLYYFVLHTVCSFFPDRFSKWFGLSINLVTFVLSQLLLFMISRKLLNGTIWQLLPVTVYGFSPIAVDIVLYIRMYSLLTLFTLLLFYLHFRMSEGTLRFPYLMCMAVTFLGMFTQYYFAISAFYLALICCILLLRRKYYRRLFCYSISMMAGVLLVLLLYPAAFRQATGSSTNNVGDEVSSNILNFFILPKRLLMYANQFFSRMSGSRKWLVFYFALFGVIVIYSVILRNKEQDNKGKKGGKHTGAFVALRMTWKEAMSRKNAPYITVTAVAVFLTVVTVAHISGQFAYLRYIYNLMPIIFLLFVLLCYYVTSIIDVNRAVFSTGLLLLALLIGANTVSKRNCEYLFNARHQMVCDSLAFLQGKPLILIDKNKNHMLTGNFSLLSSVDLMFISDSDELDIDEMTQNIDVSEGVAFLVLDNTQWSDGYVGDETMRNIISSSEKFGSYEKYGDQLFSTMYWAY